MLTLTDIKNASQVLKEVIHRTDLIYAPNLVPGAELYLKPENLQVTGSFKVRGSYYKISQLSPAEKAKGVIACSAGNHAQGVALSAQKNGIPALICLPEGAPISKVQATRAYGAEICLVKGVYDDAYQRALELKEERGLTFVHPFDDEQVIAGQGTIGLELLEQLPDVDTVIVPIGGGGLISGILFAMKTLNPKVKIYGVQAAGAPSMKNAVLHGKIERLSTVSTIADGIAVKEPGQYTFDICRHYLDGIVTVTDDEISTAILTLMEKHKLVAEGAGAVAVAAALFGKIPVEGRKTICLVSGGNIDVNILSRVINRGLQTTGRSCVLTIELLDKPGQLRAVTSIVAEMGGNILSVYHERSGNSIEVNGCFLRMTLETRDYGHIEAIKKALSEAGFLLINN